MTTHSFASRCRGCIVKGVLARSSANSQTKPVGTTQLAIDVMGLLPALVTPSITVRIGRAIGIVPRRYATLSKGPETSPVLADDDGYHSWIMKIKECHRKFSYALK